MAGSDWILFVLALGLVGLTLALARIPTDRDTWARCRARRKRPKDKR